MDPICHTLVGAAFGETGLKHRTALGMATLLVAANAPDLDIVVLATNGFPAYVAHHRGWTHGVLGLIVMPILITGLMLAWDRAIRQRWAQRPERAQRVEGHPPRRAEMLPLLGLAYIGLVSHALLDYTNSYGIQLLKPFSDRWFYGDALYIIDPYMYVLLGAAVLAARGGAELAKARPWAARVGLVCAGAYVATLLASNLWARGVVTTGLARAGVANATFMVTPVFANPLRREVIVDTGDRYERGFVWFEPSPHFRPAGFGINKGLDDPAVEAATLALHARQFLSWSRFPFFVVDRSAGHTRVFVNDYRYSGPSGREGWSSVEIDMTP
jgi:inner membrane protein